MKKNEMPTEFITFWYGKKSSSSTKQIVSNSIDTSEHGKEWAEFLASIKTSVEKQFDQKI